jgi:glycosyltransferase involved in cell wall biosynthesis
VLLVSESTGAIVEHGRNGLVHATGDVAALAGHLESLAADPARLMNLRQQSQRELKQLTWHSAAERLASVYRHHLTHAATRRSPGAATVECAAPALN